LANPTFTKFLEERVVELKRTGFLSHIRVLSGPDSAKATLDGKDVLVLCANNYLGLANHPEMMKAAKEAIEKYGAGMGTGRAIMSYDIQNQLEEKLAAFKSSKASLCYATGYIANLGGIWPLIDEGDTIVSEELNHASIIDGCRMVRGAKRLVYKHLDMKDLEERLRTSTTERSKGKTMVISDAVFSMDGDICKLPEMIELAEKYNAFIFLDEAHASGVLGKTGKGTLEHFNAYGKVEVQMGTLSKAIATVGGYIAGSEDLIYYLRRTSRPFLFSTGFLDPAACGATIKALEIMRKEPERIQKLWDNTRYFKKGLEDLGFDTGVSETPITPVIVGPSEKARELSTYLYESEKIYVQAFSYPVVPKDKARVRTIINAHHSREQLSFALGAFERAGRKLGLI
jgi:glycine C-acetyltransferase